MRRLLFGLVVTATTALAPVMSFAGNQETAEQIAANLRNSGQLHAYKIGVKFQDGTAWLRGRVTSREQMQAALKLASSTPGVENVQNQLTIGAADPRPPVRKAGSSLRNTLGKLRSSGDVKQASATESVKGLQQGTGAYAPEQFPSGMSARSVGAARSQPVTRSTIQSETAPKPEPPRPSVPVQKVIRTSATEPMMVPTLAAANAPRPMYVAQAPQPAPVAAPQAAPMAVPQAAGGGPIPAYVTQPGGVSPARYDQAHMPNYAWPSYAPYPNYAGVTYPKQYSATAWPYIGPFYPYPQVPLGWRKVSLEWNDGWWMLDFDDGATAKPLKGLFRPFR